jgi:PadR family transcriptional regulator PadR
METYTDNQENIKTQMRKGILDYTILCILSDKDAYASDIIKELKDAKMIVVEGTLYPLLIRLKDQGLLNYRWEESPQGPPRKYYCLSDKGRTQLADMDAAWDETVKTVDRLRHKPAQTTDYSEYQPKFTSQENQGTTEESASNS